MKKSNKPLAIVLGSALIASAGFTSANAADTNPFAITALETGYQVAMSGKSKDKEGKCSSHKKKSGNCGGSKKKSGSCGASKKKGGSCGASKKKSGSCGGSK